MSLTAPIVGGAALVGVLDPAWAPVANTALIIVLAVYQAHTGRQARHAEQAARDAKRAVGAARRDNEPVPDTGARRRWTD